MTDRFHHAHPVTAAQIAAELAREQAMRRKVYPARVADCRMTQAEADHELAIVAAWIEDLERIGARQVHTAGYGSPPPRHGMAWTDRRRGLERELALRSRVFPRRVAAGDMTAEDAAHRTACLAALAARYDQGWDWLASNGLPPSLSAIPPTPEQAQAQREWAAHVETLAPKSQPAKQEEMAI